MCIDGIEAPRPGLDRPVLDETWTPVDQLPAADDSDYSEEETSYVTLDFGPDLPTELLAQLDTFQLTSLNSKEPWARIGPTFLRGRHERMLGSDLIFKQSTADPDTGKNSLVEMMANTQSRIRFEKVNLAPKKTAIVEKQNASSFLLARGRGSRGGRTSMGGTTRRKGTTDGPVEAEDPSSTSKRGRGRSIVPVPAGTERRAKSSKGGEARESARIVSVQAEEASTSDQPNVDVPQEESQAHQEGDIDKAEVKLYSDARQDSLADMPDVEEF